ncbi:MAG: hypothetical protein IKU33_09065 [Bacteroidales bacterium]|nr:hypothetical protein [Bacteroidales bacterium]
MKKIFATFPIVIAALIIFATSCATQKKLKSIRKGEVTEVQLALGNENSNIPELKAVNVTRDTLKIKDDEGKDILIMKAIKDEDTGEMVATDVIDAATVTARFRNVAERSGKVDLNFQVIVPESMMDSKWQLCFYPDLFVLEDSTRLDPVIITGAGYRKAQLKGYQQYDRFLSKIIDDTTRFVNLNALEIFLKRNIPQVYAFKTDSTLVSDEEFYSAYGVSEQEAVKHYTNENAKKRNERRKARMDKMYKRYVKTPIVTEGIRLDTVIIEANGDFVYNYIQTINTRPKLRKADIILSGEILEQGQRIYTIPPTEPLAFYISSISALTDNTERYLTQVIERRASANTECRIDFELGKSDLKTELGENQNEIRKIKKTLGSLLDNDTYDLDSIVVSATASPEGTYATNAALAQRRSESVSSYFDGYIRHYRDSLITEGGVSMNLDGSDMSFTRTVQEIKLTPRSIPENWDDLHRLVQDDPYLNIDQKETFNQIYGIVDPDQREKTLQGRSYYGYLKESLYPKLRTVKFNFYLHRKGMVKDTVHTTVIDSTYMRGLQALKDMDYESALALLRPYKDFNTAIAFMGLNRNANALNILEKHEKTPEVNYLLAILYSRTGEPEKAVDCYMRSCRQNSSYVYRGNLDPEISVLIKTYGLNQEPEDEFEW